MRILTNANGVTTIDMDDEVVSRAAGVDLNTIDISDLRPSLDVLSDLYQKALFAKGWGPTPSELQAEADEINSRSAEAAAKYVKMKQRIIDWFERRDAEGQIYE